MLREALAPVGVARRRRAPARRRARLARPAPGVWCRWSSTRMPSSRPSIDLASAIDAGCDLDRLTTLARSAPTRTVTAPALPAPVTDGVPVRIAVAGGAAFSFSYVDNLESLEAAGRGGGAVRSRCTTNAFPRAPVPWWPAAAFPRSSLPSSRPTSRWSPMSGDGSPVASSSGRSAGACCGWRIASTACRWPVSSPTAGEMTDRLTLGLPHRPDRRGVAVRPLRPRAEGARVPLLDGVTAR